MSFKAVLVVEEESFSVLRFEWAFSQQTDELGRPTSRVEGGILRLELDAPPSELLSQWAHSNNKQLDGVLNIYEADRASVRDQVKFFAAHCVQFSKHFQDAHATQGLILKLTLSANKLRFGELEVDNRWPDAAG